MPTEALKRHPGAGLALLALVAAFALLDASGAGARPLGARAVVASRGASGAARAERRERRVAAKSERTAARAERRAQRSSGSARAAPRVAPAAARPSPAGGSSEDVLGRHGTGHHHEPNPERFRAIVTTTCHEAYWALRNFPDLPDNVVTEKLKEGTLTPVYSAVTFDGSGMSNTQVMNAPVGKHSIDTGGHWHTNGIRGSFDIHSRKTCPPAPAMTIEKLQQKAGSSAGFVATPLLGEVGQTVDYEIVVQNTGNVPLALSDFTDARCDAGTIAGGPTGALGAGAVPSLGEKAIYTCSHVLTVGDESAGKYENSARVTATPPAGDGVQLQMASNTVIVTLKGAPPHEGAFTIEKLQAISGGAFTSASLTGREGETVEYEIVVRNTGENTLTFSNFTDGHCDAGTIAGGPGARALAPGESSTYRCFHVLTGADESAGAYDNSATVTGTPPAGEGSAITHTSNVVEVQLAGTRTLIQPLTGAAPSSSPSAPASHPAGGVAGFAAAVPALHGPQGCVRASLHATLKAAGVQSVTFYLDGHKLKTMTAKNARHGVFTIAIDAARLRVGVHRLIAKITMARNPADKVVHATRSVAVVRCADAVLTPNFTG